MLANETIFCGQLQIGFSLNDPGIVINVSPHQITDPFVSGIHKLFQTPWFDWVEAMLVEEIVLLFKHDDISSGLFDHQGMPSAYVIQFCYITEQHCVEEIPGDMCLPFGSMYPAHMTHWAECFSLNLWETICFIW